MMGCRGNRKIQADDFGTKDFFPVLGKGNGIKFYHDKLSSYSWKMNRFMYNLDDYADSVID